MPLTPMTDEQILAAIRAVPGHPSWKTPGLIDHAIASAAQRLGYDQGVADGIAKGERMAARDIVEMLCDRDAERVRKNYPAAFDGEPAPEPSKAFKPGRDRLTAQEKADIIARTQEMLDEVDPSPAPAVDEAVINPPRTNVGRRAAELVRGWAKESEDAEAAIREKAIRECIEKVKETGQHDPDGHKVYVRHLESLLPPPVAEERYVSAVEHFDTMNGKITGANILTPDQIRARHGWFTEQQVRDALNGVGVGTPFVNKWEADDIIAALRAAAQEAAS